MQTLESLRRKIQTATDLGSVVTTMKTLAAVSIRQYEKAAEALDDYSRTIELAFRIALRDHAGRFEAVRSSGVTAAIVFGTDQGMCGQFNEDIVSYALQSSQESPVNWKYLVVGARAEGRFQEADQPPEDVYSVPTSVSEVTGLVQELLPRIERWRIESDISRLVVFHNHRASASSVKPQHVQLLPLETQRFQEWSQQRWESRSLPAFTMTRRRLLSCVVRQHLFVALFRACVESLASENASRIAAMQSAEKSIEERLEHLHGSFNQLRQSAITEELLDVVGGFEALSAKNKTQE